MHYRSSTWHIIYPTFMWTLQQSLKLPEPMLMLVPFKHLCLEGNLLSTICNQIGNLPSHEDEPHFYKCVMDMTIAASTQVSFEGFWDLQDLDPSAFNCSLPAVDIWAKLQAHVSLDHPVVTPAQPPNPNPSSQFGAYHNIPPKPLKNPKKWLHYKLCFGKHEKRTEEHVLN